ncbi:hypothetical protein Gasu2_08650 [Galdieria sulphuraria]|nr:hypothetical protein Gasu2_08650 [Galdieria sulphuraria]
MLKQRKAKNIRQKLSDTEEDNRKEEINQQQQSNDIYIKRTKRTTAFGRKCSNKRTGGLLGTREVTRAVKESTADFIEEEESKQELEDEWFPKEFKQLANSSSLVNQALLEVKQTEPEYSFETMEELKRQTFGWNKEDGEQNNGSSQLEQQPEEIVQSNRETQSPFLRVQNDEEIVDEEEVDSESEARWELDQLRRASGNNKYTRKLEKLSNKKLESFHKPELLQDPLIVLEKVSNSLQDAMKTNDEEMSKVLQEQMETEKALDNCQKQMKAKETEAMVATEKYSFYEDLGRYFDDLLDMLNEKWKQLNSLRDREEQAYQEYQMNEEFQGISFLEKDDWRLLPKPEEELEQDNMLSHSSIVNGSENFGAKGRIQKELANIAEARNALFQDVEWDYASISQVVAHFVWWRKNYPKDYDEAYGELMLSKLITEYTKIELLGCWPFGLQSLCDIQSIQALKFYHQEFGERLSRSSCLISILEGVIIPILSKWLRHLYFFQNLHQTRTMSIFYKEILDFTKDSEFLASIQEKMNETFLEKGKDILSQCTDLSESSWNNEQQWNAFIYILRMISYWHGLIPFVRILSNEDILDRLYFILCHCLPQEWPDPCSQHWLAIRALVTRIVSTIKETDKLDKLEACKKRCGYYL